MKKHIIQRALSTIDRSRRTRRIIEGYLDKKLNEPDETLSKHASWELCKYLYRESVVGYI